MEWLIDGPADTFWGQAFDGGMGKAPNRVADLGSDSLNLPLVFTEQHLTYLKRLGLIFYLDVLRLIPIFHRRLLCAPLLATRSLPS